MARTSLVSFSLAAAMRRSKPDCRVGFHCLLMTLAMAASSLAAHAADDAANASPPLDASAAQAQRLDAFRVLDRSLQGLKQDWLALALQAQTPQLSAESPSGLQGSAVTLYAGVRPDKLRLRQLTVAIDDAPAQTFVYDDEQALALVRHRGLDRLATLPLSPGSHRLRAQFSAGLAGKSAEAPPITGELNREWLVGDGQTAIELVVHRPASLGAPALTLTEWRADLPKQSLITRLAAQTDAAPAVIAYEAGGSDDPALRHARFLRESGRPFSSVQALRAYGFMLGDAADSSPALKSQRAQSLLAFGVGDEALQAMTGVTDQPEASLALAEFQFRHGEPDAALKSLAQASTELKPAQAQQASALRSQILLSQQRYTDAAAVLAGMQADPLKLLSAPPEDVRDGLIWQYNLGIALMQSGKLEQGRGVLDRLGQFPAQDDTALALRDKANLSLGWSFLHDAQGASARPVLERVRLDGPYSSRALLGLGWAELAPQGRRQLRQDVTADSGSRRDTPKFVLNVLQRRKLIDCEEYNRRAIAPPNHCTDVQTFESGKVPADANTLIASALIPWTELLTRDPLDPAVQEARSAIPYALRKLGDQAQSAAYFEKAISAYGAAIAMTDASLADIRDAGFSQGFATEALRQPHQSASAPIIVQWLQAHHLDELLDSDLFFDALSNALDIVWLQQASASPDQPATETFKAFQHALSDLRSGHEVLLKRLALDALEQRKSRLARYLEAARSGLARIHDPALDPAAGPEPR